MYKVTATPAKDTFINILNQIPEKEKSQVLKPAVRSPYIWIAVANIAVACSLILVLSPQVSLVSKHSQNNPFSAIDAQVDQFEAGIDTEDALLLAKDYNL